MIEAGPCQCLQMALRKTILFICLSTVFDQHCVLSSNSKSSGLFCWEGNIDSVVESRTQSCRTGIISQNPTAVSLVNSSLHGNQDSNTTNSTEVTTEVYQNVSKCFYFLYHLGDTYLRYEPNKDKVKVAHEFLNFSCDFEGICNDQPVNKTIQTTLNGVSGTLECCDTSLCNRPKTGDYLPNNYLTCYDVTKNGDDTPEGYVSFCKNRYDVCTKTSVYGNGTVKELFSCGEEPLCDKNITEKDGVKCLNKTNKDLVVETCCCIGDICLKPDFNFTLLNRSLANEHKNTTIKTIPSNGSRKIDWMFVGGLIAAGVLVIVIIVGLFVIVSRFKKKQTTNRLSLAYSRIAADATGDDEDIQMLLP